MTLGHPTLLGLPYDASSSFMRGAAEAPSRIREALASASTNWWTEAGQDLSAPGVLGDAGDLSIPESSDAREVIETGVAQLLNTGARPIALGGDHSVTYPVLRAVAPRHPDLTIVHFDAHPDLYNVFEGDRYSHACPFARIMEDKLATRLVQVGIRTMNGHQRVQAERFGVEVIDMPAWVRGTRPRVRGPLYISVDMDVFDPGFAPGVSHREPGGLTPREVLSTIQSLSGTLIAADVVEYNPSRDAYQLTAPLGAKVVKELASRMLKD